MSRLVSRKEAVLLKTQLNRSFLARATAWDLKKRGLIDNKQFNNLLYSISTGRNTSIKKLKRKYNKNIKKGLDF